LDHYPQQTVDPVRATEVHDWLTHGLISELTYHMGYSIGEIAAITNSPVGTVKARMFRARERLRKYLPALAGASLESMKRANELGGFGRNP
jgi:RNA polymerase sigma-70 factor, ECF subfamily